MFQKKKKRRTLYTRHKKSSLFSTISLKDKPKRKKKAILKGLFAKFMFGSVVFVVSLGTLFSFFSSKHTILSPLPATVSRVLGAYVQRNPDTITNTVKDVLQKKNVLFSSIVLQGHEIDLVLSDGTLAILSTDKDISQQIDSLQFTIAHLTIDGKRISRVDIRFDRPVVIFQ